MPTKFGPTYAHTSYTVKVLGEHGCAVYRDANIQGQIDCYLETPGRTVQVLYSEHCARCSGSGRVRKNRRMLSWKPCPTCKGRPEIHPDELVSVHTRRVIPLKVPQPRPF